MTPKECVLKLLHRALLDSRIAAVAKDPDVAFRLSNLFHTVPLQILAMEGEDYQPILDDIRKRAEFTGTAHWLAATIEQLEGESQWRPAP